MAKIIPNQESMVRFCTTLSSMTAPTVAQVNAGVDLTPLLISITASATGNTVPTPTLDTLFETSVPGTSAASFSADFYRDDAADTAWTTLERGVKGYFVIQRFGASPTRVVVATDEVEVWPVQVTSRSASAMTSNTAQMFTVTCSVPQEPVEDAIVAA